VTTDPRRHSTEIPSSYCRSWRKWGWEFTSLISQLQTQADVQKYRSPTPSVGKLILLYDLQTRKLAVRISKLQFLTNTRKLIRTSELQFLPNKLTSHMHSYDNKFNLVKTLHFVFCKRKQYGMEAGKSIDSRRIQRQ